MSKWRFSLDSVTDSAGANVAAGFLAGHQPMFVADSLGSKRNVILTDKGWVRRLTYTDVHGNVRTKDEVLVAAHPGGSGSYANSTYVGGPDIATMQLDSNTASGLSTFANTASMAMYLTFNEAVLPTGNVEITATSRDGTRTFTLLSNTTNSGATSNAKFDSSNYVGNNTLVLEGIPGVLAGTYKFRAGSVAVNGGTLVSRNSTNASANLVISGAVSNTLLSAVGDNLSNGEFVLAG